MKKRQTFAKILNPFVNEVECVRASFDAYVCAYPQMENQAVASGDYVVLLGRPAKTSR
jgi:putative methionine-R-sulfoxide reductase with GAF domain